MLETEVCPVKNRNLRPVIMVRRHDEDAKKKIEEKKGKSPYATQKTPNANLGLLLRALSSLVVVLGAQLLEGTRLDGLLDRLDILLELVVALNVLRALTQRIQGAKEPRFLHGASEAQNVLSGADL